MGNKGEASGHSQRGNASGKSIRIVRPDDGGPKPTQSLSRPGRNAVAPAEKPGWSQSPRVSDDEPALSLQLGSPTSNLC